MFTALGKTELRLTDELWMLLIFVRVCSFDNYTD